MNQQDNQNNEQLKNKTIGNMLWRFAERCGAQGVAFIVSIILARLLDPEVYGTVALITVFTAILQVFVDSGLGSALIQKKDADDLDFSTVFVFNVCMCVAVYGILYIAAPYLAEFYRIPELTALTRVLGLTLVISGVKNIQQAYVSRHLMFKRFFYSTLVGTIAAAAIGIAMAYMGFGVWALVAQQITNVAIGTVVLFFTVQWRPHIQFSWARFQGLFSFGWKLLVSALLDTVYNNVRQLIIGKFYTSDNLAFFNQGDKFPKMLISNVNASIDSVLLPVMSSVQDDRERVKAMTRRAIKTSSYIIWPMMTGLAVCSEPIIRLLLTEKWLPCVPYLQIFCFTYALWPIHTANLNAIKSMGRSDLFLKLEIVKKVIGVVGIVVSVKKGVLAMALMMIVTDTICTFVNAYPNKRLLKYSYMEQLRDLAPSFFLTSVMGLVVYSINMLKLYPLITILIQVPLGALIYITGSRILRIESFHYILGMILKRLRK